MTDSIQNALIFEIGEMILDDPEYAGDTWDALSIVTTLDDGTERMSGYVYDAEGGFEAAAPERFGPILDKLIELRERMEETGGGAFVQCLIQIKKPDYALTVKFEHDDPGRWSPGKVSMDMNQYAEALRPA